MVLFYNQIIETHVFSRLINTLSENDSSLTNPSISENDSSLSDNSKIRSAAGFALDLMTPIGPLNFSLSQPITKSGTDVTESFRFNLGTTF